MVALSPPALLSLADDETWLLVGESSSSASLLDSRSDLDLLLSSSAEPLLPSFFTLSDRCGQSGEFVSRAAVALLGSPCVHTCVPSATAGRYYSSGTNPIPQPLNTRPLSPTEENVSAE